MAMAATAKKSKTQDLLNLGGKRFWHILESTLQNQDPYVWTGGNGRIDSLEAALDCTRQAITQAEDDKRISRKVLLPLAKSVDTITTAKIEDDLSLNAWLFLNSPYKFHWYCAGVGTGKSYVGARYALRRILTNPETAGLMAANTHTQLAQSTLPHLYELLDQAGLQYVINSKPPKDWKAKSTFRGGYDQVLSVKVEVGKVAHVLMRTLQGWERIRGTNIGWFLLDEIADTPVGAFQEIKKRLRCKQSHALQGRIVGIPDLPGDNWTYEEFNPTDPDAKQYYRITFQSSTEAKHLDWLEYLLPLLRTTAPLNALQEIFARIVIDQTGRVYSCYRDGVNNEDKYKYDPDRPIYLTFDFNILSASPISAAVVQLFDSGNDYFDAQIIDEIIIPHGDTAKACYEFIARYRHRSTGLAPHKSVLHLYGDASGNHSQTISEYQVAADVLATEYAGRLEIPEITHNPLISERVAAFNAKLCNALGVASCFISKKCKTLINDLKKVLPKDGKIDKSDPLLTHISDAVGYLFRWLFPPFETGSAKRSIKANY